MKGTLKTLIFEVPWESTFRNSEYAELIFDPKLPNKSAVGFDLRLNKVWKSYDQTLLSRICIEGALRTPIFEILRIKNLFLYPNCCS